MKTKKNKIKENLKYTIEQLEKFYLLSKEEQFQTIEELKKEFEEYERRYG